MQGRVISHTEANIFFGEFAFRMELYIRSHARMEVMLEWKVHNERHARVKVCSGIIFADLSASVDEAALSSWIDI